MIIKVFTPHFRKKGLFLDYDWTIVKPKNNATFPKDIDDWEWLRPDVPNIIKDYYKRGYSIYVFTNQSKDWEVKQITSVMRLLEIPVTICIARTKDEYKPSTFLFDEAFPTTRMKSRLDMTESLFCGDALGRPGDHSNSDREFAEAIGIKCVSPEEFFPFEENKVPLVEPVSTQEVVIMVGYPGSGKTFISTTIFEPAGYVVLHGDELKTSAKMIKAASAHVTDGKSVVFDATNASQKKRSDYIIFAKKQATPLPVRIVYVSTTMEESMARNKKRDSPVPRIVYSVYNKHFQMPSEEEDCKVIVV